MTNSLCPWKRLRQTFIALVVPAAAAAGAILIVAGVSSAQTYPSKLIKLIVPLAAGGPPDVMARLTAPALSARLGQTVIVENRPGGGGTIGTKQVATATPDGHTLLFASSNFTLGPALIKNLGYDSVKDFAPIATVGSGSWILVVAPSVPARSVKELIDYAKANPGKLNWGFSVNTGPTLVGEMFVAATGIDVARISYKAARRRSADLLGGHVHMNFSTTSIVLPLIREGSFAPLRSRAKRAAPTCPMCPRWPRPGCLDLTRGFWTALMGPAGTPAGIVNRLNAEINASLATPEMKASLAKLGFEPKTGSPQDFAALLAEEIEAWKEAARGGRDRGAMIAMTHDVPTPDRIIEFGHAFRASKALLSAVELGVFTALADGPLDLKTLRKRVGIDERGARDFLDALVALGMLVRRPDGRYANSAETDLYLDRNKPTYVGGVLESSITRHYDVWGALTAALRTGKPQSDLSIVDKFQRALCRRGAARSVREHDDRANATCGEGAGDQVSLGRTTSR